MEYRKELEVNAAAHEASKFLLDSFNQAVVGDIKVLSNPDQLRSVPVEEASTED
jgi:hypothetical protein